MPCKDGTGQHQPAHMSRSGQLGLGSHRRERAESVDCHVKWKSGRRAAHQWGPDEAADIRGDMAEMADGGAVAAAGWGLTRGVLLC